MAESLDFDDILSMFLYVATCKWNVLFYNTCTCTWNIFFLKMSKWPNCGHFDDILSTYLYQ